MKANIKEEDSMKACDTFGEYRDKSLLTAKVKQGEFLRHIDSISNQSVKDMVKAEYYYYIGKHKEASDILERFLDCEDLYVRSNAWFMYSFCNLTLGRTGETKKGLEHVKRFLDTFMSDRFAVDMKPLYVFLVNAANVLLDLRMDNVPPLSEYLRFLPEGIRVFGCYIMAFHAYLTGEYYKGIEIVDTCISFQETVYVVPSVYLLLAGAMNAMSVNDVALGKRYFNKAYELAKEDGLFEPIGENHGLLYGLVETCLKKNETENYEKIIRITYQFSYGWRRIHNHITGENVADTLSTTEFIVAMLAKRGWTNKEIADYMELNVNTIKSHISNIFTKLDISSRKELKDYMLK